MKRISNAEINWRGLELTYEDGSTNSYGLSRFDDTAYIASQTSYTVTVKQRGKNSYDESYVIVFDSDLNKRIDGEYSEDRLRDLERNIQDDIKNETSKEQYKINEEKENQQYITENSSNSNTSESSGSGGFFFLAFIGILIYAIVSGNSDSKPQQYIYASTITNYDKIEYLELHQKQQELVPKLTYIIQQARGLDKQSANQMAIQQLSWCRVNTKLKTENEKLSDCMSQYKKAMEYFNKK